MGKYPVECVEAMDKISKAIEESIKYWKRFNKKCIKHNLDSLDKAITYTTCVTAEHTEADAIVAYTHKGDTIRKLAGLSAGCPIFAITDDEKTYNQLAVSFNVHPVLCKGEESIDNTIAKGIEELKDKGILEKGDLVVLSGGAKYLQNESENKIIGGLVRI